MKSKYNDIFISCIPAIIFILVYRNYTFKIAVITGFGIGIVLFIHKYITRKSLSSINKLGFVGLIIQTAISLIAENENMYFVYPIISNSIYSLAFGISILINKDLISIIARSMISNEGTFELLKPVYRKISGIWFVFFLLKTVTNLIGLGTLSFEILYGVNWTLGTPITLMLLWFSFWYPNKILAKLRINETFIEEN